jgi:hypothetical protein
VGVCVPALSAEPEIEVKGSGILNQVALVCVPAWFIDRLSRVKARDVPEEKVPHNFVAIPRFSLDARHHSPDAAISLVEAYGHGSAESTCHIVVAFKSVARKVKSFMPTSKLNGVKRDEASAEGLACTDEASVPVDDRGCVEFLTEETRGEGRGLEDRLFLRTEAVLLQLCQHWRMTQWRRMSSEYTKTSTKTIESRNSSLNGMNSSRPCWPQ